MDVSECPRPKRLGSAAFRALVGWDRADFRAQGVGMGKKNQKIASSKFWTCNRPT